MNLWFLGKGWEEGIVREEETVSTVHTAIFKMDNQQGSTIQHKELCSMLCGNLDGREVWGRMDTCVHIGVCVCIAESLCFPPETVTALLISYECESEVAQSCPTLCDPWTVAHQAPPSMGFSRQEYSSRLPFPSPNISYCLIIWLRQINCKL